MIDTNKYDVEVGENCSPSVCHCCGRKSNIGHGFVYRNDDAYAVYYVGWAFGHPNKKVSIAIAIGEWDADSSSTDRICFGLEAEEGDEEILFRVIEPDASPWSSTELLGEMISRTDALNHSALKEIFVIVENVMHKHNAIREYLGLQI